MSDAIIPNPDSMIHKAFAESGELMDTITELLDRKFDAKIEYLQINGRNAYIDTEINTGSNIRILVDVLVSSGNNGTNFFYGAPNFTCGFGGSNEEIGGKYEHDGSAGYGTWGIRLTSNNAYARMKFGEDAFTISNTSTIRHTYVLDSTAKTFSIDGNINQMSAPSGGFLTKPIYLFASYNQIKGNFIDRSKSGTRLYASKIWNNNVLVRNFIPVRIGTVGYLYDRISKQLFENQGTDAFILGPDL